LDERTLYQRLGGYDAIVVAVDDMLPRVIADAKLCRFWQNRGRDGIARERQLLIDYIANASGGPTYYAGRPMKRVHDGMGVDEEDWSRFTAHVGASLDHLSIKDPERGEMLGFVDSLKGSVVD